MLEICFYVLLVQQFCIGPIVEPEVVKYTPTNSYWTVRGERYYTDLSCTGCTIYNVDLKRVYVEWKRDVVFRDSFG